ncbi:MAG TPA: glycosyltransferase family 2 protein [Bacteroidia bacterium]
MLDLTIAIPALNEERNLPGCLSAIGKDLAAKIVVIDSGSSDNTKAIAEQFGAEFVDFKWDGKFPKKRNWYLRNHTPKTKWVLFLDADEYMTDEFKTALKAALSNDKFDAFWLNYTIYFMGKKLKGGYPLRKLALFKVGAGEYERIDEEQWSKLDMEIHEHPIIEGNIGEIKEKIDHQDFRGASHYVNKHTEYASWEANRYLKAINDPAIASKWTFKQKLKYRLMRSVLIGPAFFFGSYILLGGFRDGKRGFAFAILKMSYFTLIYCKIKENSK